MEKMKEGVHIEAIMLSPWEKKFEIIDCNECKTSCQSACKTSCTVGNQYCELDEEVETIE